MLHSFMMATDPSLSYQQNVEVMQFMEAEVLSMAQSKGFAGIFTTNTNPLTQVCVLQLLNKINIINKTLTTLETEHEPAHSNP